MKKIKRILFAFGLGNVISWASLYTFSFLLPTFPDDTVLIYFFIIMGLIGGSFNALLWSLPVERKK
jgi:hypothetical protein